MEKYGYRTVAFLMFLMIFTVACICANGEGGAPADVPTKVLDPDVSTAVPLPPVTLAEIEENHAAMTDLRWKDYRKEVTGRQIVFEGKVGEVFKSGKVAIEGGELLTTCMLFGIPLDVAKTLTKDNVIEGSGTVKDATTFLLLVVEINVEEYIVR